MTCRCFDDKSGKPVCLPLKSLDEVQAWLPDHDDICVAVIPRPQKAEQEQRPRTLVCHDMAGGYLEDRFIQGCFKDNCYRFYHWHCIDTFVYFSHYFVTIPPTGWTNAAHKHGVCMLGTLITEWDDGKKNCEIFLETEESYKAFADKLVQIAVYYQFDGWLINIENIIQVNLIENLAGFVKYLTQKMHQAVPESLVIWYDSVINTGELKWQDQLNEKNGLFFDACDGIFLNYCWNEEKLLNSKILASTASRHYDVYVGIDVFGRGCLGGGGYNTVEALSLVRNFSLSAAIFAPGWVYETQGMEKFTENENRFWSYLQPYCYCRPVKSLPLVTSFCQGYGQKYFLHGKALLEFPWSNLSIQNMQPIITTVSQSELIGIEYQTVSDGNQTDSAQIKNDGSTQTFIKSNKTITQMTGEVETCVYMEDAYIGGTCLKLKANVKKKKSATSCLFNCDAAIKFQTSLLVTYTYKDTEAEDCDLYLELQTEIKGQYQNFLLASSTIDDGQIEEMRVKDASKLQVKERKKILVSPISMAEASKHFTLMQDDERTGILNGWVTRYFWLSEEELEECSIKEIRVGLLSLSGEEDKSSDRTVSKLLGQIQILSSGVFSSGIPKINVVNASSNRQLLETVTVSASLKVSQEKVKVDIQFDSFAIDWSCDEENLVDYYNVYCMTVDQDDKLHPKLIGQTLHKCFRVSCFDEVEDKTQKDHDNRCELKNSMKFLIQPVSKFGNCLAIKSCTFVFFPTQNIS